MTIDEAITKTFETCAPYVVRYHNGETGLLGAMVGHVFQMLRGNADPKKVHAQIKNKLEAMKNN